mmetsp:Transcript_20837/g.65123  ORF Transcript_20837/g.65123 Transcript_20837/m.65123 type:complete len:320 (-) Transcript_20837:1594-2553(-)
MLRVQVLLEVRKVPRWLRADPLWHVHLAFRGHLEVDLLSHLRCCRCRAVLLGDASVPACRERGPDGEGAGVQGGVQALRAVQRPAVQALEESWGPLLVGHWCHAPLQMAASDHRVVHLGLALVLGHLLLLQYAAERHQARPRLPKGLRRLRARHRPAGARVCRHGEDVLLRDPGRLRLLHGVLPGVRRLPEALRPPHHGGKHLHGGLRRTGQRISRLARHAEVRGGDQGFLPKVLPGPRDCWHLRLLEHPGQGHVRVDRGAERTGDLGIGRPVRCTERRRGAADHPDDNPEGGGQIVEEAGVLRHYLWHRAQSAHEEGG